jgi:hypothetical protein
MPPAETINPCPSSDDETPVPEHSVQRTGLPDEATVVAVEEFTSPKGRRYRIVKTRQTDPDDPLTSGSDECH